MNKEEYKELYEKARASIKELCDAIGDTRMLDFFAEEMARDEDLAPHIKAELKKAQKDPEICNLTVYDILQAQHYERARRLASEKPKAKGSKEILETPKSKAEIILARAKEAQAFKNKYPLMPSYPLAAIKRANTNLTDAMQGDIIGEGGRDIAALKDKDVTTFFSLAFQGLEDDKVGALDKYAGIKSLTFEEMRVLSRVFSIKQYANEKDKPCIINGYTIAKCMPGGARMITEAEAKHYDDIIEKFMRLWCKIDATDEMRKRRLIDDDTSLELEGMCIQGVKGTCRTRIGKALPAYYIYDIPLPYVYAEMASQIVSIPRKDFDIRAINADGTRSDAFMSMNAQRQNYVEYMLSRIYIMKNDLKRASAALRSYERRRKKAPELPKKKIEDFCNQSHTIRFDTLFKECGAGALDRTQAKRVRDFCATALENWKQDAVIRDYQINAGKNASITIAF